MFPPRSNKNRSVQSQKQARSLKFCINVEEMLYYLSSENKGADQLRSNCKADLRLRCRKCILLFFPCGGSYLNTPEILIMFAVSRLLLIEKTETKPRYDR